MTEDLSYVIDYYNCHPAEEHRRLEMEQLELDITWRYLSETLPPQSKLLEIGAATGRYTLPLAKCSHAVTAVDISEKLLEACRQNIIAAGLEGKVQVLLADARDLTALNDTGYDAVLMMGPLYHLTLQEDRKLALQQAYDRLRHGGLIFSAFISRFGVLGSALKYVPELIECQAEVHDLLELGKDSEELHPEGFRAYYATLEEIAPLHESIGFETLKLVATEPCISADFESYNKLKGRQRQLWLDLLYRVSAEPSMVASSNHMLYIGRR